MLTLVAPDCGTGPYLLTTRALVLNNGAVLARRVTHRFQTKAARDKFRKVVEEFNIFESEREETT